MCVGERVMWHIFSVGSEFDVHTVYFHGHTFYRNAQHNDAEELSPQMSQTLVMNVYNPGKLCVLPLIYIFLFCYLFILLFSTSFNLRSLSGGKYSFKVFKGVDMQSDKRRNCNSDVAYPFVV